MSASFSINNASTNNGSFTVKLLTDKQDFINIKYNNYFISFLKYKIKFIGDADAYKYNSIVLNDTKIWILCDEEIQSLDFIDDYLRINIANETDSQSIIDWEERIKEMKDLIESELE